MFPLPISAIFITGSLWRRALELVHFARALTALAAAPLAVDQLPNGPRVIVPATAGVSGSGPASVNHLRYTPQGPMRGVARTHWHSLQASSWVRTKSSRRS